MRLTGLFGGLIVILSAGALAAADSLPPLVVAVDCAAGEDLLEALEGGEASAAPRIDCEVASHGVEALDGDDDDDDDDGASRIVKCVSVPRRPLNVEISGTCRLAGDEPLTLDTDYVKLSGVTSDARIVAGTGDLGFAVVAPEGPVQFADLTIDCSRIAAYGTCMIAGRVDLNILETTVISPGQTAALIGNDVDLFLREATILGGDIGVAVGGGDLFILRSTIHADLYPLTISVPNGATINGSVITGSHDVGVVAMATGVKMSGTRIEGTLVLERSDADIRHSEIGILSVTHGAVDLTISSLVDTAVLEQFSTLVIDDYDLTGDKIGELICDSTSNAQCLDPERVLTSNCSACPVAPLSVPTRAAATIKRVRQLLEQRGVFPPPAPDAPGGLSNPTQWSLPETPMAERRREINRR